MRPCFTFTARAADKPAVLALDEEIGFWGTQAADFRNQLNSVEGDDLTVEINSPGGDVIAGLGIYNMLRTWAASGKKVTTRVGGIAASIASVIALAGDNRQMPKNTFAMMHQVQSGAWGTADELRDAAEVTDKFNASLRNIYVDRMGVDEAKATEIMAKDTWLTAQECLDLGFATALTDEVHATAKFDTARAELPTHVLAVFNRAKPEPEVEVPKTPLAMRAQAEATQAGLTTAVADALAILVETEEDLRPRLAAACEINAIAKIAKREDTEVLAAVTAKTSVADYRALVVKARAEADRHIDTTPPPKSGGDKTNKATELAPSAFWDARNKPKKD